MIEIYDATDTHLIDRTALPDLQRGELSDAVELHLWYSKGDPSGQVLEDLLVLVYVEDPAQPGSYLRQGVPPLDEMWVELRIVGHDNTDDPAQEDYRTDWVRVGAWRGLPIPSIRAGCARYLEWRVRVPSSADPASWTWRIQTLHSEHALAVPLPVTEMERGILSGVGDPARSGLWRGGEVVVSEPADAWVHIGAREYLWRGELRGAVAADVELDQVDGNAEALAAGEAYWAVLTEGAGGVNVTKGTRAAEPAKPTHPAGELLLSYVPVDYQSSGTSIVEAEDLDGERPYDRHLALPGTGLELRVHPGQAIAGGTWRGWSRIASVPLEASDVQWLWQMPDGLYEVTTEESSPSDGALGPLWEVETDASGVVELRDRRRFVGRRRVLRLRGAPPAAGPGTVAELLVADGELQIGKVILRASDNGGGTAGATVADVLVVDPASGASESIYPSSGVDDQRPAVAYDAVGAGLIHDQGIPERRVVRYGSVLRVVTVEHAAGGVPTELELQMVCAEL